MMSKNASLTIRGRECFKSPVCRLGLVLAGLLTLTACAPIGRQAGRTRSNNPTELPGRQADGSTLLPDLWSLRPAGTQIQLGDFPVNIAVDPKGIYAAVLDAGFGPQGITVVNVKTRKIVSHTPLEETFYGITFSKDGRELFCSGAGQEVVHVFQFRHGRLSDHREIHLRNVKERGIPAGIAVGPHARRLFVANVWGQCVSRVDDVNSRPMVRDIALDAQGPSLKAPRIRPSSDFATAMANKRAQSVLFHTSPDDPFPYDCVLDAKHNRLFVSFWAQSEVGVINLNSNRLVARWKTQQHPCEMLLSPSGKYLYVANANRNTVSVLDTRSGKSIETMWAALFPKAPPGSTPNSLALSPNGKLLFVANANINAVAVFDVSTPGKSRSLGFIPVGAYPTSVRVMPDGRHLLVANGRGITSKANPEGQQPGTRRSPEAAREFIARLLNGTLSIIDIPPRGKFLHQLARYTAETYKCTPLRPHFQPTGHRPKDNPIPGHVGGPSPIKYVVYIIKENRTYDQVLGDMPQGDGDPQLCLFPEHFTPNQHKIARDFVLFDNFYACAQVSAQGHEWSMGAYVTDFVEKTWPLSYGHNRTGKFPYPSEGRFPIAAPANGYLWDRAREAGVSYRSYGEFVLNGKTPLDPEYTRVKSLKGHFDPWYRGFDLSYPDAKRADRYIHDLKQYEAKGSMPRLQIIRLPNDHTHGTSPGFPTPAAYVADNDLALGRIIQALSHSPFWPHMAIFVLEDDASNGPDHVDAHRTTAYIVSPYAKRHYVDSTMYSTCSMLRTMELILGLKPMTQFDAAATPMYQAFQPKLDLRAYNHVPVDVNRNARNSQKAWGADIKGLNYAKADQVNDLLLDEMVWHSVRGWNCPMPAPVHAAFYFGSSSDHDDDGD